MTKIQFLARSIGFIARIVMSGGVYITAGNGAPVDGTTGAAETEKGSLYVNYATGIWYTNTGTKASPVWTAIVTPVTLSGDVTMTNAGVASLAETLVKYATVTISAADIVATGAGKFGHANGYPLVAAPGATKVLEFLSAMLIYDYATASYTAGGNITVNIAGGAALTGLVAAADSVGAGVDKTVQFVPLSTAGIAMPANTGINLVSSAAFTQPGTAAGVIRVKVAYRVHTTGLA